MMTGAMTLPVHAGAGLRLLRAAVFAAACVTLSAAGHEMASGVPIPVWALLTAWAGVFAVAAALAGRERSLPGITALMLGGQVVLHLLFSTGQWCAKPAPTAGGAARLTALAGRLVCGGDGVPGLTPGSAVRLIRRAGIDPASAGNTAGMAGMPGMRGMRAMAGMPGMGSGGHAGAATRTVHGAQAMHGMGLTLPMICGHVAAGLVAGWLLRRGEAALWRMIRLSARGASLVAVRFPLGAALAAVRALVVVAARSERCAARWCPGPSDHPIGRPRSLALQHSVVRRGPPRVALAA